MAEYYDDELEKKKQRSLAEENLVEQLLGMLRTAWKSVTLLSNAVAKLEEGDADAIKSIYEEVKSNKDRIETMKEDVLAYLARIGDLLLTGSLYRALFLEVTRAAQTIEGIVYRAYLLASSAGAIGRDELIAKLKKMTDRIREEYSILEDAAEMLETNPRKSYEASYNISSIEEEIDGLYRQLTYSMYLGLKDNLVALMLLRDITDMVEDLADTLRDVAEDVKFLALSQASKR